MRVSAVILHDLYGNPLIIHKCIEGGKAGKTESDCPCTRFLSISEYKLNE